MPATCFPTAAALASTWDVTLLTEIGRALAEEAKAQGVGVILGPGVNLRRSPLCGRNFEYFSEDPLLAGELAAALAAGIQSGGVGTSVKHFAANNQETDRMRTNARIDERTLREIYLNIFERIIERARPATLLCSYNRINDVYSSENRWLLTEVLREEWGFDGLVMTDWGAVHDRVAGVAAGLDLLRAVRRVADGVIVLLWNGAAVETASWQDDADAIMELWLPGQGGGEAVARLVTGEVSPSGRLAETIPERLEQHPAQLNFPGETGEVRYGEGIFVGYRGLQKLGNRPSYPFGHGLAYTTFEFSDLRAEVAEVTPETALGEVVLTVSFTVTNTGGRSGLREGVGVLPAGPAGVQAPADVRGHPDLRSADRTAR